jgi:hypothetical protein
LSELDKIDPKVYSRKERGDDRKIQRHAAVWMVSWRMHGSVNHRMLWHAGNGGLAVAARRHAGNQQKRVWAGAISLFAFLSLVGVALSYPRHRTAGPVVIAALGAGLVLWAMFGSYNRIVELMGFAGLITAAVWDWRLKKCESATVCVPDRA